MPRIIYLDNNATTAVAPEVAEAMAPYLHASYFNPSSMYGPASRVADALREARASVAALVGAEDAGEIFFTSGATESNNWAIQGAARARPERRHLITTAVEHPSVREVMREMARLGWPLDVLRVSGEGQLQVADDVRALRRDTLLVSIMHANNETGIVFPVGELARIAKETDPNILVHTDATQAAGKLPLDLRNDLRHVDLLSLSGHKLHAPKGIGALYIRRGTPLRPLILGGHQEHGRRGGTENVPHIVGFGAAAREAAAHLPAAARIAALRDRLEAGLRDRIPWMEVNGRGRERLPNTLNVAFHCIEGESILAQLDAEGICASSGSACTSGSLDPSHVLQAMHVPFTALHGSLRLSLSRMTTDEDVDTVLAKLPEIVASLRRLSPYWDDEEDVPRFDALETRGPAPSRNAAPQANRPGDDYG